MILTLVLLACVLFVLSHFLIFVESRNGVMLDDPLLNLFKPVNLTWLTFSLIYLSLVLAVADLAKEPERLMIAIQSYILMIAVRIAAMYVMPLDPPQNTIILSDPFVQLFGTGKALTKDLFFSGHTATVFLLYLVTDKKKLKALFLAFTIMVGVSVLLQHVHYTADVLIAPFVSFGCYYFVLRIRTKILLL